MKSSDAASRVMSYPSVCPAGHGGAPPVGSIARSKVIWYPLCLALKLRYVSSTSALSPSRFVAALPSMSMLTPSSPFATLCASCAATHADRAVAFPNCAAPMTAPRTTRAPLLWAKHTRSGSRAPTDPPGPSTLPNTATVVVWFQSNRRQSRSRAGYEVKTNTSSAGWAVIGRHHDGSAHLHPMASKGDPEGAQSSRLSAMAAGRITTPPCLAASAAAHPACACCRPGPLS